MSPIIIDNLSDDALHLISEFAKPQLKYIHAENIPNALLVLPVSETVLGCSDENIHLLRTFFYQNYLQDGTCSQVVDLLVATGDTVWIWVSKNDLDQGKLVIFALCQIATGCKSSAAPYLNIKNMVTPCGNEIFIMLEKQFFSMLPIICSAYFCRQRKPYYFTEIIMPVTEIKGSVALPEGSNVTQSRVVVSKQGVVKNQHHLSFISMFANSFDFNDELAIRRIDHTTMNSLTDQEINSLMCFLTNSQDEPESESYYTSDVVDLLNFHGSDAAFYVIFNKSTQHIRSVLAMTFNYQISQMEVKAITGKDPVYLDVIDFFLARLGSKTDLPPRVTVYGRFDRLAELQNRGYKLNAVTYANVIHPEEYLKLKLMEL